MSAPAPLLCSPRTVLTPFAAEDADVLLDVFTDGEVRRYLLDDALVSLEWVRAEIASSQRRFLDGGAGLWVGPGTRNRPSLQP